MLRRTVCFVLGLILVMGPLYIASAQDDTLHDGVWFSLDFRMIIQINGKAMTFFDENCTPLFELAIEDNHISIPNGADGLIAAQIQMEGESLVVLMENMPPVNGQPVESVEDACAALAKPSDPTVDLTAWLEAPLPVVYPRIHRYPSSADFGRGAMASVPIYNPDDDEMPGLDLRSYDLSALDLSGSLDDLQHADFDDQTIWPDADHLPAEFDRQHIMEIGKDPGLGVRDLHARGITGSGVGIAIIDQPMLVDHQEYAGALRLYEEMPNVWADQPSQMHGPAVASLAVGQTVGVAPGADLYFIAMNFGDPAVNSYVAAGIRRILKINDTLPDGDKIRVISISFGFGGSDRAGYDDVMAAAQDAQAAGILIVSSSMNHMYSGMDFAGLGREPLADPAAADSFRPGDFWIPYFTREWPVNCLMVPMDSRTTASPTGHDEYVFYRYGGWSWSIPYIAGLYALAVEVDPAITPEQFWALALETGTTFEVEANGETLPLGPIVNPAALIEALQVQ